MMRSVAPSISDRRRPAAAAVALATCALIAFQGEAGFAAEAPPTLLEALGQGKPTLSLRLRYEDVDDDRFGDRNARAATLRTALGYRSARYRGFSLQLEAENVTVVGNDLYDNLGAGGLTNGVRDRPAVADPADTGLHRALLRYGRNAWQVAVGRQELLFGDQRFVGNHDWRQNRQSFDALRIDNSSLGGLRFTYVLVDRVNRIFGDGQELAAHLLNAGFELQNAGKFTLYGYLLDYRRPATAELSTATWGLEFAGKRYLDPRRSLLYEVEVAEQSDWADNPLSVEAGYSYLRVGVALPRLTVELGWERLEGGSRSGRLTTPLASLHEHNGWADAFPATPADGLEDLHLQLSGSAGKLDWLLRVHDFGAESTGLSYGRELDAQLLYTLRRQLVWGLKSAHYDADGFGADLRKWMVWAAFKL